MVATESTSCCRPCAGGPCGCMTLLIWWLFGGIEFGIIWFLIGCVCCCIPGIGKACRNVGCLAFDPLSKDVDLNDLEDCSCGSCCANCANIIWMVTFGWLLCLAHLFCAVLCLPLMLCCCPFSKIHWKFARVSLWPVGATLEESDRYGLMSDYP